MPQTGDPEPRVQEKCSRRRTTRRRGCTFGGTALRDNDERPGYVGAMLDSERRLVLVPMDPERPWVAFRRMRSWMKRSRKGSGASLGVFKAPRERAGSNVIDLRRRLDDGG